MNITPIDDHTIWELKPKMNQVGDLDSKLYSKQHAGCPVNK